MSLNNRRPVEIGFNSENDLSVFTVFKKCGSFGVHFTSQFQYEKM